MPYRVLRQEPTEKVKIFFKKNRFFFSVMSFKENVKTVEKINTLM